MKIKWNMCCQKTTEAGEDEVYITVAIKTSDGRQFAGRLPSQNGHWDLNDNGGNTAQNNITLADIPLSAGQHAKVLVALMEEDLNMPWARFAEEMVKQVPDSGDTTRTCGSILHVIGMLLPGNTDDFIGSFEINVSNVGGTLQSTWRPLERIARSLPNDQGPGTHGFRLNGDGTNYYGWGIVQA